MQIVHITGTQCSGKTYVINTILSKDCNEQIKVWDILDFYNKNSVFENGLIDWQKWSKAISFLNDELSLFFEENKDKFIIIESSANTRLNAFLSKYKVINIALKTPNKETLILRAEERKLDRNQVFSAADNYESRFRSFNPFNQEQAILEISRLFEEWKKRNEFLQK